MILGPIEAVFSCGCLFELFPPLNQRELYTRLKRTKRSSLNYLHIKNQFFFEIHWLCKTHPHWNTASIKPKSTILSWHLRRENSSRKLFSSYNSKMVLEENCKKLESALKTGLILKFQVIFWNRIRKKFEIDKSCCWFFCKAHPKSEFQQTFFLEQSLKQGIVFFQHFILRYISYRCDISIRYFNTIFQYDISIRYFNTIF